MKSATWVYDEAENVVFVSHTQPIELRTRAEIATYFEVTAEFCRKHCKGKKVYLLVDYDNLAFNIDEIDFYAAQVKTLSDAHALAIVRYNGTLVQRMAGRMAASKAQRASRVYGSRDEALAAVRRLQQGKLSVPP